jgi:hypothetical protein
MQQYLYKILIISLLLIILNPKLNQAQSLSNAIFLPKHGVCAGLMYDYSSWKNYWEGTFKRENLNLGRVSSQSMQWMASYGISNRLNVVVGVPYIWTRASAGTLAGQSNFQDLTMGLKYRLLKIEQNQQQVNFSLAGGGSLPISSYTPDLLPLSIGLRSRTLFGRAIFQYLHQSNWHLTAQATYTARGMVELDRESYYTTRQIYSSQVAMPDVWSYSVQSGYRTPKWSAELVFEQINCLGGFDIRRNDMPFVANEMDMTRLSLMGFYKFTQLADLQLVASVYSTLAGRNVGQSTGFSWGLMKPFSLVKNK